MCVTGLGPPWLPLPYSLKPSLVAHPWPLCVVLGVHCVPLGMRNSAGGPACLTPISMPLSSGHLRGACWMHAQSSAWRGVTSLCGPWGNSVAIRCPESYQQNQSTDSGTLFSFKNQHECPVRGLRSLKASGWIFLFIWWPPAPLMAHSSLRPFLPPYLIFKENSYFCSVCGRDPCMRANIMVPLQKRLGSLLHCTEQKGSFPGQPGFPAEPGRGPQSMRASSRD